MINIRFPASPTSTAITIIVVYGVVFIFLPLSLLPELTVQCWATITHPSPDQSRLSVAGEIHNRMHFVM